MSKRLRVISVNFPFQNQQVVQEETLATKRAFFDFDVVVIRPPCFDFEHGRYELYLGLAAMMKTKRNEIGRLLAQGGVLVIFLDAPYTYVVHTGGYMNQTRYSISNYAFLQDNFVDCLRSGVGEQIRYSDHGEPFVKVLKQSVVAWTAYIASQPPTPFDQLKILAASGAGAVIGGKMPYGEGHLILLPNLRQLNEALFFEACGEYRYQRQGTTPPDWVENVHLPGLSVIESEIGDFDRQISELQVGRDHKQQQLEDRSAYRKLLYEKGKAQLEPIVRRALDDLGFKTKPSEVIAGTDFEIDGRTTVGSSPGIIEIKGSKKQIVLDEFSPFVVKILADHQATNASSKGILVGNGLCETSPENRVGDSIFSSHVIDAAKTHSVALINTVELYWLCCTLLDSAKLDLGAIRELILGCNGYADLKPFCGKPPWQRAS